MNLREEIMALKVKKALEQEKKYSFPDFLRLIRKSLGLTRRAVAEMLDISEGRITAIESGRFSRAPEEAFLQTLSNFYGLDDKLIFKKLSQFQNARKA